MKMVEANCSSYLLQHLPPQSVINHDCGISSANLIMLLFPTSGDTIERKETVEQRTAVLLVRTTLSPMHTGWGLSLSNRPAELMAPNIRESS